MSEKLARTAPRGKPRSGSPSSLSDSAYKQLRDAIQAGTITPGERVMEVEIADWLKMSRTPVRNALRRLEADGIVTHEPRNGLVVARLDRQAITELYVMRENLEGIAARMFTQYASDISIDMLEDLLEQERKMQEDTEGLVRHNLRFHDIIRRGANNRYLLKSLDTVLDTMWLIGGHTAVVVPDRAKAILAEHAEIVSAMRKRDMAAAEEAARRHVRAGQRARMKLLFADPE